MANIKLGKVLETRKNLELDFKKLVSGRTFISAMTDGGKSYTIRKIIEEVFGKVGIIILDPEGEYSSLRELYPFLIIGKDIPLEIESAEFLAEQTLKENISVIFDFSTTDVIDQQQFTSRFIKKFMDLQTKLKKSYLVIVEESDEFCLTPDTEILTKDSWKNYKEIKEGELVLTLNTNKDKSEWKPIKKIIIKKHSGKLINLKNKSSDILITPEHRILCQNSSRNTQREGEKYYYKDYEYRQSYNLTSQFRIPCSRKINNNKKSVYTKDLIKLIAWIITEGSIYSKKKSKDKRGYIAITQSYSANPKYCKEIVNLLKSLNYGYYLNKRKRKTIFSSGVINEGKEWNFYLNKEASHKIFKIINNKTHEIPKAFFSLSLNELKIFFDTLMKGDGTNKHYITRISKKKKIQKYSTFYCGNNLKLANQFQYLLQLLGFRSVLSKISNQWRISISKNPNSSFKKKNIKVVNYKGIVWDIQTENSNFVARRNGKPFITGNCPERGTFKSESLQSIINIAKKGRKRGIGLIIATQRPAFVSKMVISQCRNKLIGHTEWTGDLKVIKDFLQIEEQVINKISKLNQGEFYFDGEFIKEKTFAKIGEVKTTHSGETPDIIPTTTRQIKSIIDKLKKSLPKVIEEKIKPSIVDTKKIEEKLRLKLEKENKGRVIKLETEIKNLKEQSVSEEEIQKKVNEATNEYLGKYQEQEIEITRLKKFIASIVSKGNQFLGEEKEEFIEETRPSIEADYDIWLNKFKGGARTVLEIMIKHKKLTRDQLIIMSGLSKANITNNIIAKLKRAGLIKYDAHNVELIGG